MSFDLGVWHGASPLADKEAADIYVQLCQSWPYLEGESDRVAAFYADLTRKWPEIDTVPEEKIDDKEYCAWSCALNHSGMAVVMACVWSMSDDVTAVVEDLANRHRLVLFNPQSGAVTLPEHLETL